MFNAQIVPENPLTHVTFPEHCNDQPTLPDVKFCDVQIVIPVNAIIHQRNIEGMYMEWL